MIEILETRKPLSEVQKDLPRVAAAHGFGLLGTYDIKQKLTEKGISFGPDCLVFEVCDPRQAKKLLERDLRFSTALPCRISVWRENDATKLGFIRPTALLAMFDHSAALRPIAMEVDKAMLDIVRETAGLAEAKL